MGYSISRADYLKRLQRVSALLDSADIQAYPNLSVLLETHTLKPNKPYRDYLKTLIHHIYTNIEKGKPTEPITNGNTVSAYALTISRHFLSKLWGCSYEVAGNVAIVLACTLCVNRRTSKKPQAIAFSESRNTEIEKKRSQIIYAYWIDSWTPDQLDVKERHALAWIKAGKKRGGLDKEESISIWGQSVADAVSQDGRQKSQKRRKREQRLSRAYEAAIAAKEPGAPVTREELNEYLKRYVPKNPKDQPSFTQEFKKAWEHYEKNLRPFEKYWTHKPEKTTAQVREEVRQRREERYLKRCETCFKSWWEDGKTQLLLDYGLEYRPLKKAEKIYYGITGRNVWALVPRKNTL